MIVLKPHYTAKAIREAKTRALLMLDMLEGKGQFRGDMGNVCYADGYFANSLIREFQCDDLAKLRRWART